VHIPHRGFDGVVPGDVLQRKSVRILPSLGQKRVAKSVKSGIRIGFDFITQLTHLGCHDPGLDLLVWVTSWLNTCCPFDSMTTVRGPLWPLRINLQNTLPGPPFQSALDDQISPIAVLIGTLADEPAIFSRFSISTRVIPESRAKIDADLKASSAFSIQYW
jgi:hypothetical protein